MLFCKVTGAGFDTYSIGFAADGFDEMEYARIASETLRHPPPRILRHAGRYRPRGATTRGKP